MKSELQHFGIKGQKWGIRRYQNRDGSLTPEGIKRYSEQANKYAWKAEKINRNLERKKKYGVTIEYVIGTKYEAKALQLIDKIYPEMASLSWSDLEHRKKYVDIMNWKTPKWA